MIEYDDDFCEKPPPKRGSQRFIEIVKLGCGGYFDYWGEFDCRHKYVWTCEDCPISIDRIEKEYHEKEQEAKKEAGKPPQGI